MVAEVSNLDRYKKDLEALRRRGTFLQISLQRSVFKAEVDKQLRAMHGYKTDEYIKALPSFKAGYQSWYSESSRLIKQILPDRVDDFRGHYNSPKARKDITFASYRIEDAIQGLRVTRNGSVIVDESAAINHFDAQIAIVDACKARFESSLFDIRALVQADVFDSELGAARELLRHKFTRAAGAVAGVVLEHHLQQVAEAHAVKIGKKNPTLGDLSQALKDAEVIETADWRRLQHLGDLRNKCDHKKEADPTADEVTDLIDGVDRTIKNLF